MGNSEKNTQTLTEAIAKLETAGAHKSQEVKDFLNQELTSVKTALEDIKPYLEEVRQKAIVEAKKAKNEVESQVKEHPWLAMGLVGLIGLIFGLLIGWNRRK